MKKIAVLPFLCFFTFCFWLSSAHGQMERTVYQAFEIDSVQTITLKIVGDYEVKHWAGNSILTEANIQIWKASPNILDYFIEQGRYEIVAETTLTTAALSSKHADRKPIKTKEGECTEIITMRVFIPDDFAQSPDDKRVFHKKKAAPANADSGSNN